MITEGSYDRGGSREAPRSPKPSIPPSLHKMNLYILKWEGNFEENTPIPTGLILADNEHTATDIFIQLCDDYGLHKGKARIGVQRLEPNVILKWKKSFRPMFFTNIGDEAEEVG